MVRAASAISLAIPHALFIAAIVVVFAGSVPWGAPLMTGSERDILAARELSWNSVMHPGELQEWRPFSRMMLAGELSIFDADPLPSPAPLRAINFSLLVLLAMAIGFLARDSLPSPASGRIAAALVFLCPPCLVAATRIEAQPVLLASVIGCLAVHFWLAVARGRLFMAAPASLLTIAAYGAHPVALGLFLLLGGMLLVGRSEGQKVSLTWCLAPLLLAVGWPFAWYLAADGQSLGTLLPPGGGERWQQLQTSLGVDPLPVLIVSLVLLGVILSRTWGPALGKVVRLGVAGVMMCTAAVAPWALLNPEIGSERSLLHAGFLVFGAPALCLWPIAILGRFAPDRWLGDARLALLFALGIAMAVQAHGVLTGLERGAIVRVDALEQIASIAGDLPTDGQVFLEAPAGSDQIGSPPGLDAIRGDLPRALVARRPDILHRLVLMPPLTVSRPSPGALAALDFRPERDAVVAFIPGIENEIRPLLDISNRVRKLMQPMKATITTADARERARLTWNFAEGFQAHAWAAAQRPSVFTAPAWSGSLADGSQRYALSTSTPAAFVSPPWDHTVRSASLVSMTITGRLLSEPTEAEDAGQVLLLSADGEVIGNVPFKLGPELGETHVSFEGLETLTPGMTFPPNLLVIPCRMGGIVGLKSLAITLDR